MQDFVDHVGSPPEQISVVWPIGYQAPGDGEKEIYNGDIGTIDNVDCDAGGSP
jgi:hypothetical protein